MISNNNSVLFLKYSKQNFMKPFLKSSEQGFTLIELLVVIAIVGILSGVIIFSMTKAVNTAKDTKRRVDISQLVKTLTILKDSNEISDQSTECNLGVNCENIDQKLNERGIPIPKDPDGNAYKYSALDNDFIVKGTLSDSNIYYYESATSKYVSGSPVEGQCGSANKNYSYVDTSFGTDTFCTAGNQNPLSIAFPNEGQGVAWDCEGLNGGSSSTCYASRTSTPIIGVCGTANSKTYTYDVTGYGSDTQCSSGSSSNTAFPTQGGSVNWTCSGQNGGSASGTCTASRAAAPVNGSCGTAARSYAYNVTSYSGYSQCATGSSSNTAFPAAGGSVSWTCSGQNGGSASGTCTASRNSIPACSWSCGEWGTCQSNSTQTRTCSSSPSGCIGSNPYPTSQSCTYLPPVNGVCNNSCLNCCSSGTAINPYVFNDVHYWQCAGSNGGSTSDWCIR